MNANSLVIGAVLAVVSVGAGSAAAGEKAKIERADAEKTALARVPGGEVKESELETEHGKLVWSIEIGQKASSDVTEVQVDANTGEVVSVEADTADDEEKEDDDHGKDDKDDKGK